MEPARKSKMVHCATLWSFTKEFLKIGPKMLFLANVKKDRAFHNEPIA